MVWSLPRRKLLTSAAVTVAAPALLARTAAATEPVLLRCSLETAPSHARNAVIRDYLGRIEAAAPGKIKTQLFENGQLFPDLQAGKALLQGQIEMAVPGTFSLTGIVPDADFLQLPALYGRSIEFVHGVVDGTPGQLLARQIELRLTTHETVASGQFWESGIRHALEDHQFVGEYIPIVSLAFWQELSFDLQQLLAELWRTKVAAYRADMAAAQSRARAGSGARRRHRRSVGGGARDQASGNDGAPGPGG